MAETLTADYLVIGAGAMGMAFVDTLISDTTSTIILIDRYGRPGGHWTIAYPYVRLHQPSAFYGVNSRHLGEDKIDQVGWNAGLSELASRDEVCAYYNIVMRQTFLPSGRVQYFPQHEYMGEAEFRSMLTGKVLRVGDGTRIVDATYMKVKVPAMQPPAYQVADNVHLITPNELPSISRPFGGYTVVGAGKTGIDACLWLLANGIDPQLITWIVPRDSWFFERAGLQPGPAFAESTAASLAAINGSIMAATSLKDLMERLEACVQHARLDPQVEPTMFRCATVSLAELEQVKKIGTIIRQGRVVALEANEVTMQQGTYTPASPDTLYIDCSADALTKLEPVPVFRGRTITLQSVRYCQQVFSAAFIAHVEATYGDDDKMKNYLCRVIPHPNETMNYLLCNLQSHKNGLRWAEQPKTRDWLAQARLDWFGTFVPPAPEDPAAAAEFAAGVTAMINGLCAKLEQLIEQLPEKDVARAKIQLANF